MQNKIYTIYNTLSKRYGDVFVSPSDAMAEKNCRITLVKKGEDLNEFELCRVGAIDIETGEVEKESPIRIQWDIKNNMPLRETTPAEIK